MNNQPIINNFTDGAARDTTGTIELELGTRYPIRLEFYENGGDASATLSWSTPLGLAKQIIPQTQLFSGGAPIPNFSLAATPATVSVTQGGTATSTIAIARSGGFTGAVALSASGLPAGCDRGLRSRPTTGNTSPLTFTASATAATGRSRGP